MIKWPLVSGMITLILWIIPFTIIEEDSEWCVFGNLCVCVYSLTQTQPLAQGAQALQHSQLQFVVQSVCVDGPGLGAGRGLPQQRGAQLGQDLFGDPPPQEVATCLTQRTQHLAERKCTSKWIKCRCSVFFVDRSDKWHYIYRNIEETQKLQLLNDKIQMSDVVNSSGKMWQKYIKTVKLKTNSHWQ